VALEGDGEDLGLQRRERLEEAGGVLVGQQARDQRHGPTVAGRQIAQRPGHGRAGVGIVAAVQPEVGAGRLGALGQRPGGQALEPRRPVVPAIPRAHGGLVDARIVQGQQRRDGQAGVGELVLAGQGRRGQVKQAVLHLHQQPATLVPGVEIAAHQGQGTLRPGRRLASIDRLGLFLLAGRDHGRAGLDDPGLLLGDLGARVSPRNSR
jgi:hypothetical protein